MIDPVEAFIISRAVDNRRQQSAYDNMVGSFIAAGDPVEVAEQNAQEYFARQQARNSNNVLDWILAVIAIGIIGFVALLVVMALFDVIF